MRARATSGWWWTAYRAPACARGSTTGAGRVRLWRAQGLARPAGRASCICRRRCWTRWIRRTWPSGGLSLDKSGPEWRVAAPDRQDARRLETGNLNYPGIAGWAGALDLIEQADPARIEPWALELSRALADGRAAWA